MVERKSWRGGARGDDHGGGEGSELSQFSKNVFLEYFNSVYLGRKIRNGGLIKLRKRDYF